jgi:hypothetical protein
MSEALICRSIVGAILAAGLAFPVAAQTPAANADVGIGGTIKQENVEKAFPTMRHYSPYTGRSFPTRPLFGDTHLHTSFSMDAGAFGARLEPRDAYRLARGEEIMASSGQPVKLSRPLDFLVVTDHSDGFGFFPLLISGDPAIMADPQGRGWNELIHTGRGGEAAVDIIRNFGAGTISEAIFPVPGTTAYQSAWQKTIEAAEEYNDPGRFTAFIGYEWTSNTAGNNLHRNVIFRDNADKASQIEPFTTQQPLGSDNPRDLWKWMGEYQAKTGGRALAIAHNGNLSNGIMFPIIESFTGQPIDREYAEQRSIWEPLYEATQIKGDGEAHPLLSPNDEFADYETWDKGNLDLTVAKRPEMLEFEYARSALKNGLKLEQELGANPYKFGMVGSTDSHTGLTAVEEDNFFGKTSAAEPEPERLTKVFIDNAALNLKIMDWEQTASGYAAVWATENTRTALWDAMKRKETYATTGPRMVVRFFGGWDFVADDSNSRLPANVGYAKGVPMGGDLSQAPEGKAPSFLVAALKDPIGANLDRYQIVKGWMDGQGQVQEKVYDVAWAGDRVADANGKLPAIGDTVDVENATWTNTIGATELITVWQDPDFDPAEPAFYYGRVLEIPTPRWTAYDAKYFGTKPLEGTVMKLQERAYTSPIWYTPKG